MTPTPQPDVLQWQGLEPYLLSTNHHAHTPPTAPSCMQDMHMFDSCCAWHL